jgi:hypothetical protein
MIRDAAGCIVGPFGDKDAAGRFIERMIDAFDLCREHRLLVLAPAAQACTYKEMGRCAAPCDGSESMSCYRERVRAAIRAVTEECVYSAVDTEHSAMQCAATAHDFERAGRHKAQIERLRKLAGPATTRIGKLADFRFLIVWRSGREGWASVAVCERGFVRWLADFELQDRGTQPCNAVAELCRSAMAWVDEQSGKAMDREQVDVLGLISRERVVPDVRRTAWFVPLHRGEDGEVSAQAVMRAAAAALKPRKAAPAEPADGPVHEIEAVPEQLPEARADA